MKQRFTVTLDVGTSTYVKYTPEIVREHFEKLFAEPKPIFHPVRVVDVVETPADDDDGA